MPISGVLYFILQSHSLKQIEMPRSSYNTGPNQWSFQQMVAFGRAFSSTGEKKSCPEALKPIKKRL